MTPTMLKKGIIDASDNLRLLLKENRIIDYGEISKGHKIVHYCYFIMDDLIDKRQMSFYRPTTKNGDPRFWIYGLSKKLKVNDLLYITIYQNDIISIPLVELNNLEVLLKDIFGINYMDDSILSELIEKISKIKENGWIESTSPFKSNPKDVGETFEKELGIQPNSLIGADYKGEIELKTKRIKGNSLDTLFSKVPDWEVSKIKSSADMILTYGYKSNKPEYDGFYDLYVTVGNTPNNQGLFNYADDEKQMIGQFYRSDNCNYDCCNWLYSSVKKSINEKHPKTVWVGADEKVIDGKIHFKYTRLELTQKPIFAQFTNLINRGIITYDWRGRVKEDKTKYKDKGHCFRISPKNRNLLFGETLTIEI